MKEVMATVFFDIENLVTLCGEKAYLLRWKDLVLVGDYITGFWPSYLITHFELK
jgi:hypothetical protein